MGQQAPKCCGKRYKYKFRYRWNAYPSEPEPGHHNERLVQDIPWKNSFCHIG